MNISEHAQKILKNAFPFTESTTQYIARFATKAGKELAIERERTEAIYLWLQKYDQNIDGVEIKNSKSPGQAYERNQTRNSNLNEKNTPKLKLGNRAYYLKVESLGAFEKVIDWYSKM
jgi:hypothetical protein